MVEALALHNREFMYFIDYVIRTLASGEGPNLRSKVESILSRVKSLDFEHSMLALALADDEALLRRACRTITNYNEHGLMLRYANVDSYIALLLYVIENRRRELIRMFSKCAESLVEVLRRSLDELGDKLDTDIAKTILDVFKEQVRGGNPSHVIRSSKTLCNEYVNKGERGFCALAIATIATLAGVDCDLGEVVEYEKQITEYIQDLEKAPNFSDENDTPHTTYSTLKYYIIKRKGEEILRKESLNFRDLNNKVMGALHVLTFLAVFWLSTYLMNYILAIFSVILDQLFKTLLIFGISVTPLIPPLVRQMIRNVSIWITSLLFKLKRWLKN